MNFFALRVTSNQGANPWDYLEVDTSGGPVTITMPLALSNPDTCIGIKKISSDTNAVTIALSGGDTIEVASITTQNVAYYFGSDGVVANWFVAWAYATQLPTAQLGDIVRWNVNGDGKWDAVNYAQALSYIYPIWGSNPVGVGPMAYTSSGLTFLGPIASINPTATVGAGGQYGSTAATASTTPVGGMRAGNNGNNSQFGMLAFYRYTLKFSLNQLTNVRYWMGLACWNSTSARGNNSQDILATTAYASDTPNKTTLGFRFSAGTDTHWQAVAIVAGGAQTTVDTGVTPDLNIHLFEMVTNITGTAVIYLIDGVVVATITTNLPIPSQAADSWGEFFWCVDNKNTAHAASGNFYYFQISHK
jgi:hypothetical protein